MKYALITDEDHRHLGTSTVEILQEKGDKALASLFFKDLSSEIFWINRSQYEDVIEYVDELYFGVGDRINHYKDNELRGEVIYIDLNLIVAGEYSSTCLVLWDGGDIGDIQWTNKLEREGGLEGGLIEAEF